MAKISKLCKLYKRKRICDKGFVIMYDNCGKKITNQEGYM